MLFSFAALFAALRYHKTHSYLPLVLTAVCIGLGMETKLSTVVVAFPIAAIFLIDLIKLFRNNGKWVKADKSALIKFIIQMAVFAAIVFPLGLFFEIYTKVKYDRPIAYVWDLVGEYGTTYFMYIDPEIYNPFVRLFLFPSPDLFWNMSNIRYMGGIYNYNPAMYEWGTIDFNCWTAFIKTGLFSEVGLGATQQTFGDYQSLFLMVTGIAYALAILTGILFVIGGIILTVSKIIDLVKGKGDLEKDFVFYFLAVVFLSSAISYMAFCMRYPVGCTMNARYAMLRYLPIGLTVGALFDFFAKRAEKKKKEASVPTGFWSKK